MDRLILRALGDRARFRQLRHLVPESMLTQESRVMLQWYDVYFNTYPEHPHVQSDALKALIRLRAGEASPDSVAVTLALADQLKEFVDDQAVRGVIRTLTELDFAGRAGTVLARYGEGAEVDVVYELDALAREAKRAVQNSRSEEWIQTSVDEILEDIADDVGIKWRRIPVLYNSVGALQGGVSVAIAARPDKGKCLAPNTEVLLADGTVVKAKEVKVGDVLAGPYRNNTVLSTTTGVGKMYRVKYPWGEYYDVNDVHVLSLKRSKTEGAHHNGDVLNVPLDEYLEWPESRKERYKGWKSGVDFPERPQSIDPYVFGLWLGDGTSNKPQITTKDPEILNAFTKEYGEPSRVYEGITYDFWGTPLMGQLRELGVLGNKFIPDEYLKGSREQRLELLAGLIDSDGYAGDGYEIVTVLPELAKQYVWLARSLGFHATCTPTFKRATNSEHEGGWYSRVRIGSEAFGVVPVRLARKGGNTRPRKRAGLHFGFKVEYLGVQEYVGWTLDGDHLFLLGDFTVTHNTSMIADTVTDWAPQCVEFFGVDRPILWLNNEGNGRRIIPRLYQAALNANLTEITEWSKEGTLVQRYEEAINAPEDYIRVKDIHGANLAQIEQAIEDMNPCVVVLDMIANVRVKESKGGNKADAVERLWQDWRELQVIHDFIGLATVQISQEGGNQLYPPYSALKDSKTGIQGATDIILMLGSLDNVNAQYIRGISTPKNKFAMPGKPSYVTGELYFDAPRSRFLSAEPTPEGEDADEKPNEETSTEPRGGVSRLDQGFGGQNGPAPTESI